MSFLSPILKAPTEKWNIITCASIIVQFQISIKFSQMEDFTEIASILAKITNIELDPLIEENAVCDDEIGKFHSISLVTNKNFLKHL